MKAVSSQNEGFIYKKYVKNKLFPPKNILFSKTPFSKAYNNQKLLVLDCLIKNVYHRQFFNK